MTDDQYEAIWAAFRDARETTRECMRWDRKTETEAKADRDADDAAVGRFLEVLDAARLDITIQS